jgi:hypothetical protein
MLKNVNKNTLSKANMRTLRSLRRENVKKAANFKRTFNEKQAQRRAYLISYGKNRNYWVNNEGKNIRHINPDNWVQTNNYNKNLVIGMEAHLDLNRNSVKVFKLKMKRG